LLSSVIKWQLRTRAVATNNWSAGSRWHGAARSSFSLPYSTSLATSQHEMTLTPKTWSAPRSRRSPWGVPVIPGDRFKRLRIIENRISETTISGYLCPRTLSHHQHFYGLACVEWKPFQNEFPMVADGRLTPMCSHALSILDLPGDRLLRKLGAHCRWCSKPEASIVRNRGKFGRLGKT
jgi:hypothetical protein